MGAFGEVVIPERAWRRILRLEVPGLKLLLTVENKGAFVDFPKVPATMLVFLPGENTSAIQQVIARLDANHLAHFGDLDAKGIGIFLSLKSQIPRIHHFIPRYAEEYIRTHAQDAAQPWPERDYSQFGGAVESLVSNQQWLEQEALVLDGRFPEEVQLLITELS